MNLPDLYQENMKELLKDDYDEYLSSLDKKHYSGLRVNTHKISIEDFLKISPFELTKVEWCKTGFYYESEKYQPAKHPYYYAGLYYLQEPSAMLPAEVLDIEDNDVIFDGCAAPGGKSSQLLAKASEDCLLVSNDISVSRCYPLNKNLQMTGRDNYCVISSDITKLADRFENRFDKILLDAPCSGEGMFRKDPSLIKSWQERGNEYYQKIQKDIALSALKMLKTGGKMVYSTCTFSLSEDEKIIEYLLDNCPELKAIPIEKHTGFVSGYNERTKNCVKLFPHKVKGEGHFVCLLQKGEKLEKNSSIGKREVLPPKELSEFFRLINKKWFNGSFKKFDDRYYFCKDSSLDFDKVRTISSGLYLGCLKKDRFEPSNALALALKKEEFVNVIDLNSDDSRVIKYLKGETIEAKDFELKDDYCLICVSGHPLGFAKVNKGILKNKYEVNYRWQ